MKNIKNTNKNQEIIAELRFKEMPKKLNIGCGRDIREGYLNCDIVNVNGVDKVFDFNGEFPFEDNMFEEVRVWNCIHCCNDLVKFMEEIYRVLKNGGIVKIQTFCFLSMECANDPYYKTKMGYNTFNLFNADRKDYDELQGISYDTKARFKILKRKWIFSTNKYLRWLSFIPNIFPRVYGRFFWFYFPSNNLYFELEAVK